MRFEVEMERHETRTIEIEAADRDKAEQLARHHHPGFRVEAAAEPLSEAAWLVHRINTRCGVCGRAIWEGDVYSSGDDYDECMQCAAPQNELTS